MHSFNQNNFFEQSYPVNMFNAFPKAQVPVQPNMMNVFMNLQQTVVKQQMLLKLLLVQQQQQQQQTISQLNFRKEANIIIKNELQVQSPLQFIAQNPLLLKANVEKTLIKEEMMEDSRNAVKESSIFVKREPSVDTEATSEDLLHHCLPSTEVSSAVNESDNEEDEEERRESKMIRRNGFKTQKSDGNGVNEATPRKSNKIITPKRPPSKAKHLWINFGRKIIEFGINNTKDEVQERIKTLIGKLSSKKDFEDIFAVRANDSDSDKSFKVVFGRLALFFIKFKADIAFEGSKYREQMITQKSVVAQWVSKLINEQIEA